MKRILVIRLGALGDFVLSFGAFAAIRAHHRAAEITLLTTEPYADLARRAPWFDRVEVDARPGWWDLPGLARLTRQLRGYGLVYDLQTSRRSNQYFRLAGRPPWSGIASGVAYKHSNPRRDAMHTLERQREQLAQACVTEFPEPDLRWLIASGDASVLRNPTPPPGLLPQGEEEQISPPPLAGGGWGEGSQRRAALLIPGASPHRPAKRWPIDNFATLATVLHQRGLTPIIIGTRAEAPLAAIIRASCPGALDLTGRTSLADVAALAARSVVAVGNDTGPMHLAAAIGCPSVVLFSAASDPALTAPRGPGGSWPTVLRVDDLADLSVERVAAALP